ncbi:hypothetical protein K5D34_11335 [Pseudomonas cichorii]|nr:hypothetical protein [Pseudomonas cichorii]MBX8510271.1 hypothetical protein [Pseudomonas cichorii]MBX8563860.1 hypothetical protein [Pseudomonas cichorii]MBX8600833.1 hypothetical protein [Pseudomonas cichorii]
MSTTIHQAAANSANQSFDAQEKRALAVAIALEIIAAKAAGADAANIANEFDNLSRYADQIQTALIAR